MARLAGAHGVERNEREAVDERRKKVPNRQNIRREDSGSRSGLTRHMHVELAKGQGKGGMAALQDARAAARVGLA